jgi:hypothetical protein
MIAANMRSYSYSCLDVEDIDDYGQPTEASAEGTIKMAIYLTNQNIDTANSLYSDAQYVGLTLNSAIDDTYIINYGDEKLKVLYTTPSGKYFQVFMSRI